jgi:nucleosome assembly protein 1-like 1
MSYNMSNVPRVGGYTPTKDSTDDDASFFKALPLEVRRALQGLRGVEVHVSNLRKEFRKEVLALELKVRKAS